jgi:uncharacterized caspase-like protein
LTRVIFFFALLIAAPALAEKRVALVIGNSAYKYAPVLANPKNDAEGVAAALKRLKFDVIAGIDLDEAATRRLLREFAEKLDGMGKEDTALLFYAGHGLQVNGKNYLVPVDAKLEKERDLDFQAVSFDFVQSLMEKTAQTNIVILDSCRDNPLARTLARGMGTRSTGIGRGLAEMRGINDTLIVYATSPGNVALDGADAHSPFTAALLQHIERPGLEIRHMISEVRATVIAATKGQQVPWEAASLTRQIYFVAPGSATPSPVDVEVAFWNSIRDSKNPADFRAYLQRYPEGSFAALARIRIAELERAAVEEDRAKDAAARAEAERKRIQAETLARLAGQRMREARMALRKNQYAEARRLAGEAEALLKEAKSILAASTAAAGDLDALKREVAKSVEARVAALLRQTREFVRAGKFDEAKRSLSEAAALEPDSAEIGATRRDYEAARKKVDEAKARAEEDRRKKEEAPRKPETKRSEPPVRPGELQFAGRTGAISRLSPERRVVMRIHLQFGSSGVMGVSCVAELADGGQTACYGQPNGAGTWSLNGSTLCLSSPVINLAERTCYQVSGSGGQLVLSGPGLIAGLMLIR